MFQSFVNDIIKSIRVTQSCPDTVILAQPQEIRRAGRRSRAYSQASESTPVPHSDIAKWDDKRQKCLNCKHIYLKYLSPASGFCSMDCKSNAMYLTTLSEKIKAAKEHQLAVEAAAAVAVPVESVEADVLPVAPVDTIMPASVKKVNNDDDDVDLEIYFESEMGSSMGGDIGSYMAPATFAEFHTQKLVSRPVEWSFSALY
ncbi:Aste57867_11787 [Aphanomyces stellatus]|uniref:Aste57867_11787 protein n=1 Tax=Aphanomyces stellatus TaxID=120398 RepID=A0A485KTX4_9STRA|nr:hypothetical protein As57867_011742 [Aphanomyces stellatus]VFT88643.1 Aste57867_11787 [Aphanomyces stellatus]